MDGDAHASSSKQTRSGSIIPATLPHQRSMRTTRASIDEADTTAIPSSPLAAASRLAKQASAARERQRSSVSLVKGRSSVTIVRTARRRDSGGGDGDSDASDANDSANHFFAIETRLALQERLVALQTQLHDLLVRTKLAWMKCFAANGAAAGIDSDALRAANELVATGEQLMATLQRAFATATATASVPIREYSALVDKSEADITQFQQLVSRIAQQTFHTQASASVATATASQPASALHQAPTAPMPVTYDLPSMKTYCARVAPSYASYLPARQTRPKK